jgi:hypothetical protein
VVYIPDIAVRSTSASGASITKFDIYEGNVLLYQSSKGESGIDLYDAAIFNGTHNIVVKAWDTAGTLYQAEATFTITGEGYGPCAVPSSPGINFCEPPAGAIYSTDVPVGAAAKGESTITNIAFYLNGNLEVRAQNTPTLATALLVQQQGVPNIVKVDATDSSGNKYSVSKTVIVDYTYSYYSCFYTCTPGINVVAPQSEAYLANTFNIDMQIVDNPEPIISMKAYLDGSAVATSDGPNLQQEITNAPNGTHILTIEGWDTEGTKYFIQENININVSE